MSNNATTLAAALEKRGLPGAWHSKIIEAMAECNMLGEMHATSQDTLAIAKAQATAKGLEVAHNMVAASLARLQIPLPGPGKKLDPWQISAAGKAAGWPSQRIMEVKAQAARCGLLD